MKSIRAEFLRPDALPGVNHMRGMQYKIQNLFVVLDKTLIRSSDLVHLLFKEVMCGMNDNLESNNRPRN